MNIENLILENRSLIYEAIKKLNCTYKTEFEFEKIYDAGLDGLIRGANTYDETKGKPSTWLMICIKSEIKHHFTKSSSKKRFNVFGKDLLLSEKKYSDKSLLEIMDTIADLKVNIEEDLEKKLEIEKLIYAINKVLTPFEKRIISKKYGLNGYKIYKITELIEEEKISKSYIYFYIKKSKLKLKEFLENNDKEVFILENR